MRRILALAALLTFALTSHAAPRPASRALSGLDAWLGDVVHDWNCPGMAVGVVKDGELVFAKGYGYRDYGKKLPMTPETVVPIASNTKLFTAVTAGTIVEEGGLAWDEPIAKRVPSIRFHDDDLQRTVTLRDMLSHRTGITRHDMIWYKSDSPRKDLFERLVYLEPTQPIRTTFLYNNMMYLGAGYAMELVTGRTWEQLVRDRIFQPLGMTDTCLSIAELKTKPEHGVPWTERRDSFDLYEIPYYDGEVAVGPAGSINSNVDDLSHWVIALMDGGKVDDLQVIPAAAISATLEPTIALPNTALASRGWGELLNSAYGMGRWTASYRGHLIAYHGGDINGFHSQVSLMPEEGLGVIVLIIGDHCAPLYNVVMFGAYERMLGMSLTPWSQRQLEIRLKAKEAGKQSREKAGADRVAGTRPSHPLDDYVGEFEHPAYGVVTIGRREEGLDFAFHRIQLPLEHFHYDRFDTPDDEQDGKWSVSFLTNPQGEVDRVVMSLDEAEATFTRRVPAELTRVETLRPYAGGYSTPTGGKLDVALRDDGTLAIVFLGQPATALVPWRPRRFRVKEFSDVVIEFVVEDGKVTAMKQIDPSAEITFPRR